VLLASVGKPLCTNGHHAFAKQIVLPSQPVAR
jgi:hypothetical protein